MIAKLILALHNAWEWITPSVRTVLVFGGLTFLALVQAFGWTVPQSLTQAQAEIALFVAFAAPTMVVFVQSKLVPTLVTWLLSTFSLAREMAMGLYGISPAKPFGAHRAVYTGRWVKVA